ncbi:MULTISPECIES: hypothetical protein [Bacillus]|uniref:hypothetical protein n=1 Tax=Bacillus TaxID=1386 RepID=UPI000AE99447|nr:MULTISPECIES: hypothetical protein [Bacillus cereus group]MED2997021.1 hypothetical protein [Bacillus tropicus]
MAKTSRETLRERIEKDLYNQLKKKKIVGNHYEDLVQDYLWFWCKKIRGIASNL